MITAQKVQELRMLSGASMMDCKKALEEVEGDIDKACNILKARGKLIAEKKSERKTSAGLVSSYIHTNGRVGVLIKIKSETDFVARNPEFGILAHDLCLHIAAAKPSYVKLEDVPTNIVEDEKIVFQEEFEKMGKSSKVVEQMVNGKIEKHFDDICLLRQPFVKNPDQTIKDVIDGYIAKFGENIEVDNFVRYEI